MTIDKTQISGFRFMFAIAYFLQSSALLTSFLSSLIKQDSWITVLICVVLFLPVIWLYRTIMVKFPDKNLVQVMELVFGKVIGKILGFAFFWFFLTLTTLNLQDLGGFAKITVMSETPTTALSIMCILVIVYAVKKGIKVVLRFSAVFSVVEITVVIISLILVFNQLDFTNFLPMFNQPFIRYVQGVHVVSTIPFGELVAFLMITPNIRMRKDDVAKFWYWGFFIGLLTFMMVIFREIAVLGNLTPIFTLPGLNTYRLVHIGTVLNRIESLFAMALIMLIFFKVSFLTYVTVIAFSQVFNIKAYNNFVFLISLIIVPYVLVVYPNPVANMVNGQEVVPFVWMVFEMVIPLAVLIMAYLRKLPKPQKHYYGNKQLVKVKGG